MGEIMSEWHENIPPQGVFCRFSSDESLFILIKDKQDFLEFLSDYTYQPEDLTPLTAAEMWQFMPWQGIKDAPEIDKFIAKIKWIDIDDDCVRYTYCMAWRSEISKSGFMRDGVHPLYESFEWLPLPLRTGDL
jgi:hypothetical protein